MNSNSKYKYLSQIQNPNDLKNLKESELIFLAQEIRNFLIENIQKTGGHLGVNLGVVELTLSLHYAFQFLKEDFLIFDVGHQSYVHKILTGRKDSFSLLKKKNGISGYINPEESVYDLFTFGHAGTGISVASGIAEALKNHSDKKQIGNVVVVVGDASILTGVSMEALNKLSLDLDNFILILNDNGMSISKTEGSLAKHFSSLKENYHKKDFLKEKTVKSNFFQYFHLDYQGPIDGHNISELLKIFNLVREKKNKPTLIHILTEKGKGFLKAESHEEKLHAIKGQDPPVEKSKTQNPIQKKEKQTYTKVFSNYIIELAKNDKEIVALTAAMKSGTGLDFFQKVYPDRFYDCGISEQHMIAFASGMSLMKMKPICAIYSTFLQRAYDQVFQEVALNNKKIIFCIDRAGIVGEDGASHAGIYDIAYLKVFPNFVLMSPKDAQELRLMLFYALYENNSPIAIRWPKDYVPEDSLTSFSKKLTPIEKGKFEILKEGKDLIILAYGSMVEKSIHISEILKKEQIDSYLVNIRFAKPLDEKKILELAELKKPIFILEEHSIQGSIYSSISEILIRNAVQVKKVYSISVPDTWVKFGSREEILSYYGLDVKGILKFILEKI